MGRATARCFVLDDVMDRIVWAKDRAGDCAISDLVAGVGLPVFLAGGDPTGEPTRGGSHPRFFSTGELP